MRFENVERKLRVLCKKISKIWFVKVLMLFFILIALKMAIIAIEMAMFKYATNSSKQ
jgi:cell division protein FtsL